MHLCWPEKINPNERTKVKLTEISLKIELVLCLIIGQWLPLGGTHPLNPEIEILQFISIALLSKRICMFILYGLRKR